VPGLVIGAEDDPVIDTTAFSRVAFPDGIELALSKHGGHLGFLGFIGTARKLFWMDERITEWVKFLSQGN